MEGTIANFRQSRHVQKDNHMIIIVDSIESRADAEKLVGKKVTYETESGKKIEGKVSAVHGNKGAVRAIFEKGMPGQALTKKVQFE